MPTVPALSPSPTGQGALDSTLRPFPCLPKLSKHIILRQKSWLPRNSAPVSKPGSPTPNVKFSSTASICPWASASLASTVGRQYHQTEEKRGLAGKKSGVQIQSELLGLPLQTSADPSIVFPCGILSCRLQARTRVLLTHVQPLTPQRAADDNQSKEGC